MTRRKPQPSPLRKRAEAAEAMVTELQNEIDRLSEVADVERKRTAQWKADYERVNLRLTRANAELDVADRKRDRTTKYRVDFTKRAIGWTARLYEESECGPAYGGSISCAWSFSRKRAGRAMAVEAFRRRYRTSKPVDNGPSVKL